MKKRIVSLLLVFVMVLGMVPSYVYADSSTTTPQPDTTAAPTEPENTVNLPAPAQDEGSGGDETETCSYCSYTYAEDGSLVHGSPCYAAYAFTEKDFREMYVELSAGAMSFGVVFLKTDINDESEISAYPSQFGKDTVMYVTDFFWDKTNTELWYKVEIYTGSFPNGMTSPMWFLQTYTDPSWGWPLMLSEVYLCPHCGELRCQKEHKICPACGGVDCEKQHTLCSCGNYDCTELHFGCADCGAACNGPHLICRVCGQKDCTETHVYCSYCDSYTCTAEHNFKPATTPVIPKNPSLGGDAVSVTDEWGNLLGSAGVSLPKGGKISLSAWGAGSQYQWQICYNMAEDLWVNIEGQNSQGILVSYAMLASVLQYQGSTALRCVIDGVKGIAIPINITDNNSASGSSSSAVMPAAGLDDPDSLQKAYVVVEYEYSDGRIAASTDFAEIIPGNAYSHSYALPNIPGYKATLQAHSYGDSAKLEGSSLVLNFAEGALTESYTMLKVVYIPDYVKYTVVHYRQNVDDDNYTVYERVEVTGEHKTGEVISDAHKSYPGFYNLLYETPTAAADGSTVIEVYYDRYYYLMTFKLGEMGYGVDPIYARFGTPIEIGKPTREGYTFLGWTLNGEDAEVPAYMPEQNQEYTAKWRAADMAPVSVVIWGENPNDDGYSYQKTIEMDLKSGETLSWENIMYNCGLENHQHSASCGYKCGYTQEHSHSDRCYSCNGEHTHTVSCYKVTGSYNGNRTISGNAETNYNRLQQLSTATPSNNGIYRVGTTNNYYYYIKIGENYHRINTYNYDNINNLKLSNTCNQTEHSHNGECLNCTIPEHSHSESCYACGLTEHTHTKKCEARTNPMDSNLWVYKESDTVTVDPNGTTVLNVCFDRAEFTLTFVRSGSTVKTITEKWGADIHSEFPIKNGDETIWWTVPNSSTSMKPGTMFGSLDTMPAENITFTYKQQTDEATLHYYVEALPNAEGKTALEIYSGFTSNNYSGIDGTKKFEPYKNINVQTSGYLTYTEEFHNITGFRQYVSYPKFDKHEQGGRTGDIKTHNYLLYARNGFDIVFYNPSELIKTEQDVPYEMPLNSYYWEPTSADAPAVYEPGSVQFSGWYLNPEGTGTEFDFTTNTMPAGPNNVNGEVALALYAKWEPVEHKVNYFLTKDSMERGETIPEEMSRLVQEGLSSGLIQSAPEDLYTTAFAEAVVKHGAYIGKPADPGVSVGYEKIHPRAGYTFQGWFYNDEEGKETAFDPENIPVHSNLNLYAKWNANVLCKYNVYFALDIVNNSTGRNGSDGIPDVDANGKIIYVAEPISGSALAGQTNTYSAKGGEDLYEAYREGFFPTVGSHSVTIDIKDTEGTSTNSYTFLYRERDAVPYVVKYLNRATGENVFKGQTVAAKNVDDNKNVVVTENFVYIQGFMPDKYQKTLVVSAADGAVNEIIFWYTEDIEHALYVVNHYIQELDADLNHIGWTNYKSLQNTGDIGTVYSAAATSIDGFTLSEANTEYYNRTLGVNGSSGAKLPTDVSMLTDGKISGQLSDKGMELNFYYTRNIYPYEFRYMLNGTTVQLAEPEFGKAAYGSTVIMAAKEIHMDIDGDGIEEDYRLYDPTETSKSIGIKVDGESLDKNAVVVQGQAVLNVATFYYVRCTQTMTVTKQVIDKGRDTHPDPGQEFEMSLLIHAKDGYHKTSYNYTKSDGSSGTLNRVVTAPNTLQFTLKAGETITIEGLPTAEYTISEINLPTGYYASFAPQQRNRLTVEEQLDLTVTNTYEPAALELSKTVQITEDNSNIPEVSDFEFTLTLPAGAGGSFDYTVGGEKRSVTAADGKLVFSLKNGESARFENLPLGGYNLTEADYRALGYKSNLSVDGAAYTEGSTVGFNLNRGSERSVDFLNKFPVGDLSIQKTFKKQFYGTAWEGDSFRFTLERSERLLISGNSYDVYVDDIKTGTATVGRDGKLEVEIEFDAEDAAMLNEASKQGMSIVHTMTIKNLPAGTYSVSEEKKEAYIQSAKTVSGLVIPAADAVVAAFTNELVRGTGDIYLEKELVKADDYYQELPVGTKFSFTFELTELSPETAQTFNVSYSKAYFTDGTATPAAVSMVDGKFTLQLEKDMNLTVYGLPCGTYRIIESTVPQYANNFAHGNGLGIWVEQSTTVTDDGAMYTEFAVEKDETFRVKCTNVYPVSNSELIIQKLLTKEYSRDTLPEDENYIFTVTLAESHRTSYDYTVYNEDGSLAYSDSAALNGLSFRLSLAAGQYAVVPGMPVCEYTVSENVDLDEYNASYSVYVFETGDEASEFIPTAAALNASGEGTSANRTFSAGKTDAFIFENEYRRHLGKLSINKHVSGTPHEPDSFIFRIVGDNGVEMDVVLDSVNGYSVTVYDLPLGKYTVTEDADWSWRYDCPGSAAAELTVDDTEAELDFTNTVSNKYWLNGCWNVVNVFEKGGNR